MAQRPRVLLIEDDAGTLDLLTQIVERAGYEPLPARRGTDGLRLLQESGADLILLDLMLRDVDGWTVLRTIRADEWLSSIPVLIVSAKAPPDDNTYEGLYEGYFIKPFEVDALVTKLADVLDAQIGDAR